MKMEKGYIVLGKHKITGLYVGYIENSFSMGSSTERVKVNSVFKTGRTNEMFFKNGAKSQNQNQYNWCRKHALDLNKHTPEYDWKVYRINSKHCPVIISFQELCDMKLKRIPYDKFRYRNQLFYVKK